MIQVLAVYGLFNVLRASNGSIYLALGKPSRLTLLYAIGTIVLIPSLVLGVTYWLSQLGLSSRRMGLIILADVFLGLFAFVLGVAAYAPLRARQTFREMQLRGFEICTSCGYSLEHLSDSSRVCPECGASPPSLNETQPTLPPVHKRRSHTLPPSGLAQWSARPSSEDDSDTSAAGPPVG